MSPSHVLPPPPASLPQHDRNEARRTAELEAARSAHQYSYAKANIRGLAMTAALPDETHPTPSYLAQVAEATAGVLRNGALVNGRPDEAALARAVAAVQSGGPAAALKLIQHEVSVGVRHGRVDGLHEYLGMFRQWPAPGEASDYFLDSTFARMSVAGPNPAWFRRVDPSRGIPEDFEVGEEHYRAAMGGEDSLARALAEGRLFLSAYRQLLDLEAGSVPVPDELAIDYAKDPEGWDAAYKQREASYANNPVRKAVCAPLALYTVPRGARSLMPVAIQLFPAGHRGVRHPVYTPRDGIDWLIAKTCVLAADGSVHEAISHLGLTHLVQEAFCLAMHNCLAPRHPLFRLLAPHFEGTQSINAAADRVLVSPGGGVDSLLLPTIGSSIKLAASAVQGYDFNACTFPALLESRGVAGDEVLGDYPYRDDGKLIWAALEKFIGAYVSHWYSSDAEVAADAELAAFVKQVGEYDRRDAAGRTVGGGIRGVGEDGARVATRAYLTRMLTQIIWNGSAQHAAVNFPQANPMSYAPLYALAMVGAAPTSRGLGEADYQAMLPRRESARYQIAILQLLAGVYYTRLGHYDKLPGWFDEAGAKLAQDFKRDLASLEETINERNRHRRPYVTLLPSRIPQSINI